MHNSCLRAMKNFVERYLTTREKERLKILEVGSRGGGRELILRKYFEKPDWEFVGLDIVAGRNVDVVSKDPYHYPFPDNHFDVVISANTFEHVEDLHKIIKEIARLTKDLVCIVAPNTYRMHRAPVDCWRIFPDGMRFLLEKVAGLEILECKRGKEEGEQDTIGIARKK